MKKQNKKQIQQVEKEQLITILRRPSGLSALINRPKYPFTMSLYRDDSNNTFDELNDFFESIEVPLQDVSVRLFPRKRKLLHCWKEAHDTQDLSLSACTSLLRVLMECQESADAKASENSGKQFDPVCFLFSSKYRNSCFNEMRPLWIEAAKIDLEGIFSEHLSSCDPYWSYNFPGIVKIPKLPTLFKKYLLPLLHRSSTKAIREWASSYRSFDLEHYTNVLHSISRMLKLGEETFVRKWCIKLLNCPPTRRAVAAALIVQTKVYEHDPGKVPENIFAEFFNLTSKKNVPARFFYFLEAIKKNIPVEYVFDGFRLANRYCPHYRFRTFIHSQPFSIEPLVKLANYVRGTFPREKELPLLLWEECGKKTGFRELIANPIWAKIGTKASYDLLNFIADRVYRYSSLRAWPKYRILSSTVFPEVFEILLNQVPRKYRVKFSRCLGYLGWELAGIEDFLLSIVLLCKALQRICKPPFERETYSFDVLVNFVKGSKHLWPAFLSAPDSSFLALEKSCRSRNNGYLIERGIRNLLRIAPLFTIKCFRHYPGKLFSVARLLGVSKTPDRVRMIKAFMSSSAGAQNFRGMSIIQTYEKIKDHLKPGISNPLPKVLSKFATGECNLTRARVNQYKRILFENLNLSRLEMLEDFILQNLHKPFSCDAAIPGLDHAMQLMRCITDNRRQFKRFLRAFFRGDNQYVYKHPRTRKWLQDHPEINHTVWQNGIGFSGEVNEHGTITIQVESNPFEVLKMGTYAGSCLGIGGGFSYSAVAVLLDANKQVLYARNEKGVVLARQLLAISDDNKLVCFSVYPAKISKSIKVLFRKYDRRFSKELKVDLSSSNYKVCNILSQDWYDDFMWNLKN